AMAARLQPAQHHDRQQIADVEAGRGSIEPDIGGDRPGRRLGIEPLGVRNLMDESSVRENAQEIGLVGAHACRLFLSPLLRRWCNRSSAGFNSRTPAWRVR